MAQKSLKVDDLLGSEEVSEKLKSLSFEQGLGLLEELVGKVESEGLPLEKMLLAYERGVALSDLLSAKLEGAQQKLKIL